MEERVLSNVHVKRLTVDTDDDDEIQNFSSLEIFSGTPGGFEHVEGSFIRRIYVIFALPQLDLRSIHWVYAGTF
jgi:hypothetical protein